MKRKVSSQDLLLGMYVTELDRPWEAAPFEPPFELQGFTIYSPDEIEKVRKYCRYVYIDPNLGTGAERYLSDSHQFSDFVDVMEEIAAVVPVQEYYPEKVSVEDEFKPAQVILDDTLSVFERVVKDVKAGNTIDTKSVKTVVGGLVESVVRNPAASTWLVRLKHRDQTSYSHSICVCVLALAVGRFLGLPKEDLNTLGIAALMQDVGKIRLPVALLSKKDRLTETERELLKKHVDLSVTLLHSMPDIPKEVLRIVAMHHERFDGSGYPRGLARTQISVHACIAGMVDSYEAMISERPHRGARTSFQALMELYDEKDRGFPGGLVEQFIQCVGIFPVGSFVELNTGEIAVVVRRNQVQQLKPRLMVLVDMKGNKLKEPQTLDLAAQYVMPAKKPRVISKIVDPVDHGVDPAEFFL